MLARYIKPLSALRHYVLHLTFLLTVIVLSSCLTFYEQHRKFNDHLERGELLKAHEALDEREKFREGRNKLLYYMNQGVVTHLMGDYKASNDFFEKAYETSESYARSIGRSMLSFMVNPKVTEYQGEDFELIMIHYYKALNFLMLQDHSGALVEARRMNIQLQAIAGQYNRENRYKRDAFGHLLMGLVYDAGGDYNNAFIAYRNALDIYSEDYRNLYDFRIPAQLKKDLVRTAHQSGLRTQRDRYMDEFGFDEVPTTGGDASAVFLWHNGFGPVKSEWSINFQIIHHSDFVVFNNSDLGLTFTFPVDKKEQEERGLRDIQLIRVAFPKYDSREPYFEKAEIKTNNGTLQLEPVQNIDGIAKQSLRDRMVRELGEGLLRFALKKAGEQRLREENVWLGIAANVFNIVTEQADTRNWQSLPHTIHYTRVPLNAGINQIEFIARPFTHGRPPLKQEFTFEAQKGQTLFHHYHSLESRREVK